MDMLTKITMTSFIVAFLLCIVVVIIRCIDEYSILLQIVEILVLSSCASLVVCAIVFMIHILIMMWS